MRQARRLKLKRALLGSTVVSGLLLAALAAPAAAQDATWLANPGSGDYNTAANWTPAAVPTGTAFFGNTATTGISFSAANTSVGGWNIQAGAPAYTFTVGAGQVVTFTGSGISGPGSVTVVNDGDISFTGAGGAGYATFTGNATGDLTFSDTTSADHAIINGTGGVEFNGSSTAGNATIFATDVTFLDSSGAGSATITNNPGGLGILGFHGTSTAATATIANYGGLQFFDGSTAGDATITNFGALDFSGAASAGTADILNGADMSFRAGSTAGSATITNDGPGFWVFYDDSSAGSAEITNDAVLIFSGNSTAGSSTISNGFAGRLTFSQNSTAGSAIITNNDEGVIRFDGNSTAGNAQLINNAGGTISFAGSAGPAGDNKLSAGSIAGAGDFLLGANQLTVGSNNLDTAVSGVISDTAVGSLVKTGTGTLSLDGINTYTGATTVDGGVLSVNGSITASSGVTVASGGTLGGTGTVSSTTVESGGTLAPGNSIGTLSVSGNLTLAAGSTYAVEVSPDAADLTNVSGTADLSGGTVAASYATATYIEKSYTIVNAQGGLGGTTFAGLTGTAPTGFTQTLAYDGTTAYLALDLAMREPEEPGEPGTPEQPNPFDGISINQRSVANAIVSYFDANGGIPSEFAALDPYGLSLVSGEPTAGAITAGIDSAGQFLGLLGDQARAGSGGTPGASGETSGPAAYAAEDTAGGKQFAALEAKHSADQVTQALESRWQSWGGIYGGSLSVGGDAATGSHDTDADTFGIAGGISRRWGGTQFGMALGGGHSNFDLADALGGGDANTFNAGLFARQEFGDAYVSGAAAYGFNDVETSRAVPGDTLTGEFDAHSFSGRVEAGYGIATPLAMITPYAAFQAIAYRLPGYTETGAGSFALSYEGDTTTVTRTEFGARFDHMIALDSGARLTLSGRAALAINGGDDIGFTARFVDLPGTSFAIVGATPDRYSALVDAGAEYRTGNGFFAALAFQGEFSGNVTSLAGKAKIGFEW